MSPAPTTLVVPRTVQLCPQRPISQETPSSPSQQDGRPPHSLPPPHSNSWWLALRKPSEVCAGIQVPSLA